MRCDNCGTMIEPTEDGLCDDCLHTLVLESGVDPFAPDEGETTALPVG